MTQDTHYRHTDLLLYVCTHDSSAQSAEQMIYCIHHSCMDAPRHVQLAVRSMYAVNRTDMYY